VTRNTKEATGAKETDEKIKGMHKICENGIYTVSQKKTRHSTHVDNFEKC